MSCWIYVRVDSSCLKTFVLILFVAEPEIITENTQFVEINGHKLRIVHMIHELGSKVPLIVLIHGLGGQVNCLCISCEKERAT